MNYFIGNMKTHIKRVHPDQTVVHNIEALSHEENQTIESQTGDGEALTAEDVIAAGATSIETDDGTYDLQLYTMQDVV